MVPRRPGLELKGFSVHVHHVHHVRHSWMTARPGWPKEYSQGARVLAPAASRILEAIGVALCGKESLPGCRPQWGQEALQFVTTRFDQLPLQTLHW